LTCKNGTKILLIIFITWNNFVPGLAVESCYFYDMNWNVEGNYGAGINRSIYPRKKADFL